MVATSLSRSFKVKLHKILSTDLNRFFGEVRRTDAVIADWTEALAREPHLLPQHAPSTRRDLWELVSPREFWSSPREGEAESARASRKLARAGPPLGRGGPEFARAQGEFARGEPSLAGAR